MDQLLPVPHTQTPAARSELDIWWHACSPCSRSPSPTHHNVDAAVLLLNEDGLILLLSDLRRGSAQTLSVSGCGLAFVHSSNACSCTVVRPRSWSKLPP